MSVAAYPLARRGCLLPQMRGLEDRRPPALNAVELVEMWVVDVRTRSIGASNSVEQEARKAGPAQRLTTMTAPFIASVGGDMQSDPFTDSYARTGCAANSTADYYEVAFGSPPQASQVPYPWLPQPDVFAVSGWAQCGRFLRATFPAATDRASARSLWSVRT